MRGLSTRTMTIMLSVLLIAAPILSQQDACMQAQVDAQSDVNSIVWFGAGFLCGVFGWGAAYLVEPTPNTMRLVGQEADFVAVYTQCYKTEGKKIQTTKAMYGCLAAAAFNLLVMSTAGG